MVKQAVLSKGEILVILGLLVFDGRATLKQLKKILGISERYIRNIIVNLKRKRVIDSLGVSEITGGIFLGSPYRNSSLLEMFENPREKIYVLTMDFSQLLENYPEILKWTENSLKINSPQDLLKHLEKVRKEVIERR